MRKIRKFSQAGNLNFQYKWENPDVTKEVPELSWYTSNILGSTPYKATISDIKASNLIKNTPHLRSNGDSNETQGSSNDSSQKKTLNLGTAGNQVAARSLNWATDYLSGKLTSSLLDDDSYVGQNVGNLVHNALSSSTNTIANNILNGELITKNLGTNTLSSIAGGVAGLAGYGIGQGINVLGGDSRLSRGIGAGVGKGISMIGGSALSNVLKGEKAFSGITDSVKAIKAFNAAKKAGTIEKGTEAFKDLQSLSTAGKWNLVGMGGQIVGTGLQAAFGPSHEYNGKYGNITRTMDSIYDMGSTIAGQLGPVGMGISGLMTLNKGLSNIFGSTDGMCVCAGTKIFTASGDIINIEDLLQEQGIIGWDENSHNILPNTIVGIIEPRQKECLEIELKNGTILRCSIDHPILSNIKERAESHRINGKRIAYREWSFRRADELQVGNWVGLANNIDYWGTEEMPNAYLVGMLIGDGTYTYESSCKLWTADPSTWKYLEENNLAVLIRQYTPENSNGKYSIENRDYRIINGIQLVKDLGIAYQKGQEKTLPKNIGKYNKDSICKLIAGLYDTDGSFSVDEEKGDYKITLYQSNLELLENLKLILQKLGIFTTIYARKASINKMSNGKTINSNQSYRLEVTDRNSIINFYKNIPLNIDYKKEHLERIYKLVFPKLDKDHCDLSGAKQYKIVSIKHIGIQTVYNLEASETHTYLANGIITHNTKQDAILGSAFMPAPVKWLNMWGAKTTDTFNNQSWQNTQKTNAFMGNAFGNLGEKFDKAREEAGKTYGTFSRGSYNRAQDNIDFANTAWDKILAMADQNELQKIRSQYMTSINNQRYAQNIQGGWSPLARGKYGMKILNNATNHNIGMRLLSGAALIDNKQMILCNVPD